MGHLTTRAEGPHLARVRGAKRNRIDRRPRFIMPPPFRFFKSIPTTTPTPDESCRYVSRAVQFHPHGGQFDFVWPPARTPHGGASYVWCARRNQEKYPPEIFYIHRSFSCCRRHKLNIAGGYNTQPSSIYYGKPSMTFGNFNMCANNPIFTYVIANAKYFPGG